MKKIISDPRIEEIFGKEKKLEVKEGGMNWKGVYVSDDDFFRKEILDNYDCSQLPPKKRTAMDIKQQQDTKERLEFTISKLQFEKQKLQQLRGNVEINNACRSIRDSIHYLKLALLDGNG